MIKTVMMGVVIFLAFCALAFPAGAADTHFSRQVLDNGLTVLVNEMPSSPMAAVYVWVRTGAANEGKFLGSGITHFVEHMLFKGTARRGIGVIPEEARAMGGSINAMTSHDYTLFTLSVPVENFTKALDLMADMMQSAVFDPAEVEREREVIQKEMKMSNDRPERKLNDAVAKAEYLVHPYRHPVIGYPQIFKAVLRDQLVEYYKTYYAPNNMILSIAGGIKPEAALSEIKKIFGDFPAQTTPARLLPQEPQQVTPRWAVVEYPTELIRLVIAYQGMPLFDRDLFATDVLAMALGSGQSSRFHQELYEKKRLVESVGAGNDTPMDRGNFEISCVLKADNVDKVVAEVQAMIDNVKARGLKPEELEKVKRVVMAENVYGRQTAEGVAHRAAMEEAFAGDAQFSEKYLEAVRAVTNDDIKRVASKYLLPSSRSIVVMKPAALALGAATAQAQEPAAEEEVSLLSNGIKLILKKDASLPLVSVRAMFKGGMREEPEDKPGLAELTGRVWSRGVKGKTAEQLFREIESRAGSLSAGAGLDAFSVGIDVLSEDISLAFDDLELLLKSPVFPEDQISKEKQDMLTELQARKDSIARTSFRALEEVLFIKHPMRRDPLGTPESLEAITRADLAAFYNRFVSSRNIIVAVYGDIDVEKVKQGLERRLGKIEVLPVETTRIVEPPVKSLRVKELSMDKEQAFVVYGFHGPKIGTREKYALEVAVNVLSSPLGGRMFKRIRDELGKAYALSGFCSPGIDVGMCAFYVMTTEDNVARVRSLLEEELKNVADKGFSQKELSDAKSYLKSDFARDHQTISAQAGRDISSEFYGLGVKAYRRYNRRIDAVSPEAAQEVVRSFLDVSKAAVVITRPAKSAGTFK